MGGGSSNVQKSLQKSCESNKTPLYLCICRREAVVSVRGCETENCCAFLRLPWAGPDLWQGISRCLKERLHLAHEPKKQKAKKENKKPLVRKPASCFPLIFTAGRAREEFIFSAKTKLYSACVCVTRSANQITAALEKKGGGGLRLH